MRLFGICFFLIFYFSQAQAELVCSPANLVTHADRGQIRQKYEKSIFRVFYKYSNYHEDKEKTINYEQIGNAILVSGQGYFITLKHIFQRGRRLESLKNKDENEKAEILLLESSVDSNKLNSLDDKNSNNIGVYKAEIISQYKVSDEDEYIVLKSEIISSKNREQLDKIKFKNFDFKTRPMDNYGSLLGYFLDGKLVMSENASVVSGDKVKSLPDTEDYYGDGIKEVQDNNFVMLTPSVQGMSGSAFINQYGKLSGLASSIYKSPQEIISWNDRYLKNVRATNILSIRDIWGKLPFIKNSFDDENIDVDEIIKGLSEDRINVNELEYFLQNLLDEDDFLGVLFLAKMGQDIDKQNHHGNDSFTYFDYGAITPRLVLKALIDPEKNNLLRTFSGCLIKNEEIDNFLNRHLYYNGLLDSAKEHFNQANGSIVMARSISYLMKYYEMADKLMNTKTLKDISKYVLSPNFISFHYMQYYDRLNGIEDTRENIEKKQRAVLAKATILYADAVSVQYKRDTCRSHYSVALWRAIHENLMKSGDHFEAIITLFLQMNSYPKKEIANCLHMEIYGDDDDRDTSLVSLGLEERENDKEQISLIEEEIKKSILLNKSTMEKNDAAYLEELILDSSNMNRLILDENKDRIINSLDAEMYGNYYLDL